MSDIERRMGEQGRAQAAHVNWMREREAAFRRTSDERVSDFVGRMRARNVGTTALFQTARYNTDIGRWWNSTRVTTTSYEALGRGWVISEADKSERTPTSWVVLDEQGETPEVAPRVLMASRIIAEAPKHSTPPELPYVALLDGKDLESSILPIAFAQESEYDMLVIAANRLCLAGHHRRS